MAVERTRPPAQTAAVGVDYDQAVRDLERYVREKPEDETTVRSNMGRMGEIKTPLSVSMVGGLLRDFRGNRAIAESGLEALSSNGSQEAFDSIAGFMAGAARELPQAEGDVTDPAIVQSNFAKGVGALARFGADRAVAAISHAFHEARDGYGPVMWGMHYIREQGTPASAEVIAGLIGANPESANIVSNGFQSLREMDTDNAPSLVVKLVEGNPGSRHVVRNGLSTLAAMKAPGSYEAAQRLISERATDPLFAQEILVLGNLERGALAKRRIMEANPQNEALIRAGANSMYLGPEPQGAQTLHAMVLDNGKNPLIVDACMEALCRAETEQGKALREDLVRKRPDDWRIVSRAFEHAGEKDPVAGYVTEERRIAGVADLIEKNLDLPQVVASGVQSLRGLRRGYTDAIVALIRKHPENPALSKEGIETIGDMACAITGRMKLVLKEGHAEIHEQPPKENPTPQELDFLAHGIEALGALATGHQAEPAIFDASLSALKEIRSPRAQELHASLTLRRQNN
jgi:hypothetical protein